MEEPLPSLRVVFCLAFLANAGAVQAQRSDPLNAPEREVRSWAAGSLNRSDRSNSLPDGWRRLEVGDLDAFMARAAEYTRVFPSPGGQLAAVVTWSRPTDLEHALEVSARLSVRDLAGRELTSFAVEPLQAFDLADDGSAVVAHGEEMARILQCGALNTHLVFYSGGGKELARVERGDFAPGISTTILTGSHRFVVGTTGRVVGYDLANGREAWNLPLTDKGDRPSVTITPEGDGLAILSNALSGPARVLLVDSTGATLANKSFDGRINPGSGFAFADDLVLVQQIEDDGATFHLLDPRTLRSLRSVRAN